MFRYYFFSGILRIIIVMLITGTAFAANPKWKNIGDDGIHDPDSPAIGVLQEPGDALSKLPSSTSGNKVDWVKALEQKVINPRTNIWPETKVRIRETKVLMKKTGEMPVVLFPHRQHTLWLDCKNCHEKIFKSKIGANKINMLKILNGEYCGRCHGAVAFPLTECGRCHSVPRSKLN